MGLLLSSAGLVGLMYGVIRAGTAGWATAAVLGPIGAGVSVLALFAAWEARLSRRRHGTPLVDVALFSSSRFTWGVLLTAFGALSLFGVMFTLPQYFEAVRALTAEGAGMRLLPVIGGLVVGAVPADRLASRAGTKITVAVGFAVIAVGLGLGTSMTVHSAGAFTDMWTFLTGLGAGLAFATAASAAVVELSPASSGVGSALLQAVTKLGPAFGAAVLGSVLNASYRSTLHVAGVPAALASAARSSVFVALAVAQGQGSSPLAASARAAFVHGVNSATLLALALAAAAVVLALVFLPTRRAAAQASRSGSA